MLQTRNQFTRWAIPPGKIQRGCSRALGIGREKGCAMDFVTIAVAGLIIVAYVVGSLTSNIETETELPHHYR